MPLMMLSEIQEKNIILLYYPVGSEINLPKFTYFIEEKIYQDFRNCKHFTGKLTNFRAQFISEIALTIF